MKGLSKEVREIMKEYIGVFNIRRIGCTMLQHRTVNTIVNSALIHTDADTDSRTCFSFPAPNACPSKIPHPPVSP